MIEIFKVFLLLSLLLCSYITAQNSEVLDSVEVIVTVEEEPTEKTLRSEKALENQLKELPNSTIVGELSGHPTDIVIDGISGFRHNYSIMGIPIGFASTSSTDLSLLGNGRYESVNIKYNNRYMNSPIGSNINFVPKVEGSSLFLVKAKSNRNFSALASYLFPKKYDAFDIRLTTDYNLYKNSYDYHYNNGTLNNTKDDTTLTYSKGWSNNFHVTLAEKIYSSTVIQDVNIVERSIPFNNRYTDDPIEKVFAIMIAANINTIFFDEYLFTQNIMINAASNEVIDTTLAIKYNMGYTSHLLDKKTKLAAPLSVERFFDNSNLSINVMPSYDISDNVELISKRTVSNSKRFLLNDNISYSHNFSNVAMNLSLSNANSFDNSKGIYRVFNSKVQNYREKKHEFDYHAGTSLKFYQSSIDLYYATATRFPSLYELYGDNLFVIPNPTLESEKSTIKAGATYNQKVSMVTFNGSILYNNIDNLITANMYQQRTIKFFNTGKAEILTLSGNVSYDILSKVKVKGNIAYNAAVNLSSGNLYGYTIPNIHPLTAKVLVDVDAHRYLTFNVNGYYYSEVFTNRENRTYKTPEADDITIYGSYGFIPQHVKIDLGLSLLNNYFKTSLDVENLLNNRVSLSTKSINQGRIYSLTLSKTIEVKK